MPKAQFSRDDLAAMGYHHRQIQDLGRYGFLGATPRRGRGYTTVFGLEGLTHAAMVKAIWDSGLSFYDALRLVAAMPAFIRKAAVASVAGGHAGHPAFDWPEDTEISWLLEISAAGFARLIAAKDMQGAREACTVAVPDVMGDYDEHIVPASYEIIDSFLIGRAIIDDINPARLIGYSMVCDWARSGDLPGFLRRPLLDEERDTLTLDRAAMLPRFTVDLTAGARAVLTQAQEKGGTESFV